MRGPPCFVLLLLAGLGLAAEPAPALRLTVLFRETVIGQAAQGADRAEMDALLAQTEDRLRRARAEAIQVPPAVARVLREDIGILEAEQERMIAMRGGVSEGMQRRFTFADGHLILDTEAQRMDVDLAKGTAVLSVDGQSYDLPLAPAPDVIKEEGQPGDVVLGRETRRFSITANGRVYEVLAAPALLNPFRKLLTADAGELERELARLPGMPLRVVFDAGDFVRRIEAIRIEP